MASPDSGVHEGGQEAAMQVLVEIGAAVAGMMMGLGMARLALAGILTLTFGRRL